MPSETPRRRLCTGPKIGEACSVVILVCSYLFENQWPNRGIAISGHPLK